MTAIRVAARSSKLSVTQTGTVQRFLEDRGFDTEFVPIRSIGDVDRVTPLHQLGRDGAFTSALEDALLADKADVAVHSLKDLPTLIPEGLVAHTALRRQDSRDILLIRIGVISDEFRSDGLPSGTRIGTSSLRRRSQMLARWPGTIPVDIRGNVETRLAKLVHGWVDGIIIAKAGIDRLELELPPSVEAHPLPLEHFPTAPGQGALGVEFRSDSKFADVFQKLRNNRTDV